MLRWTSTGLTALAALFFLAAPAVGQGVDIGVEAGLNVSDIDIEGSEADTESLTGFRAGGVLRLGLGSMFGLQSGLYYSQKGAEVPLQDGPAELELNYFEVPLVLTIAVPTGPSPVTPRLYAGGQVGFESSCKISDAETGVSLSEDCDDPEGLESESTDFSLILGGGLDFAAGPGKITVDARYDHGVTDIFVVSGDAGEDETNRNIALSAGYLISLP